MIKSRLSHTELLFYILLAGWITLATGSAGLIEEDPILAISMFKNIDYKEVGEHEAIAARDWVAAELINRHNCFVCSRSRGYSLAQENNRALFALLDKEVQGADILQANCVITTLFRKNNHQLESVIVYQDLQPNNQEDRCVASFITNSFDVAVSELPQRMARHLELTGIVNEPSIGKSLSHTQTWVVLPFRVLQNKLMKQGNGNQNMPQQSVNQQGATLSLLSEVALQESQAVQHLVDHNSLSAVLQEHEMQSLSVSTEGLAGHIARLVGADRVVWGSVCQLTDGRWRATVFLVDSQTTIMLAAAQQDFLDLASLEDGIGKVVRELIGKNKPAPRFIPANPDQRRLEAEFYLYYADEGQHPLTQWTPSSYGYAVIAYCEAAYLLAYNDPRIAYRSALCLLDRIIRPPALWYFFAPGFSGEARRNAAELATRLLEPIPHSRFTPAPRVHQARALLFLNQPTQALELVERHLSQHPNAERQKALLVAARTDRELGNFNRALERVEEAHLLGKHTKESDELQQELASLTMGEEARYKLMRSQKTAWKEYLYDLPEFVSLMRKYDGAEAAYDYLDARALHLRDTIQYQDQLMKTYQALGQDENAYWQSLCILHYDDLNDCFPDEKNFALFWLDEYKPLTATARTFQVEYENAQRFPPEDPFRLPIEVRSAPTNICLCLIPGGDMSPTIVRRTAYDLKRVLGIEIQVCPPVELPASAIETNAQYFKYHSLKLAHAMMKEAEIPTNALFTVCLVREDLAPDGKAFGRLTRRWNKFTFCDSDRQAAIVSAALWERAVPKNDTETFIANQLTRNITGLLMQRILGKCDHYPCVGWCRPPLWGTANRCPKRQQYYTRFGLCPDCQQKWQDTDLLRAMEQHQAAINLIRPATPMNQD